MMRIMDLIMSPLEDTMAKTCRRSRKRMEAMVEAGGNFFFD
jgi:hypothetical protein